MKEKWKNINIQISPLLNWVQLNTCSAKIFYVFEKEKSYSGHQIPVTKLYFWPFYLHLQCSSCFVIGVFARKKNIPEEERRKYY